MNDKTINGFFLLIGLDMACYAAGEMPVAKSKTAVYCIDVL